MAYISIVSDQHALTPVQADVFAAAERRFGFVPDVVRAFAVRAEVAKAQSELRDSLVGDASTIGARRAELISLAVSGLNGCQYCGTAHAGTMVARGQLSSEQAGLAFNDWRKLHPSDADRAMLEFAEKLTFHPSRVGPDDIETLRAAGFDDLGIYDIVLLTAYRNFVNRVNDGLGVSTEKLRGKFGDEIVDRIAGRI